MKKEKCIEKCNFKKSDIKDAVNEMFCSFIVKAFLVLVFAGGLFSILILMFEQGNESFKSDSSIIILRVLSSAGVVAIVWGICLLLRGEVKE
jgi:hypothetical protein